MEYCRIERGCDVHVVSTQEGFRCVDCPKEPGPFRTRVEIYNHLVDHVFSKDRVPDAVMERLLTEHKAWVTEQTPKWTPEEAQEMLDKCRLYFGEQVRPISQYCKAFRTWQRAVDDAAYKAKQDPDPSESAEYYAKSLARMSAAIGEVSIMVSKSNLLARLLYDQEELRTEPCPIHKGKWSGCVWGEGRCPHCMSGDNVTGWLPNPRKKEPV